MYQTKQNELLYMEFRVAYLRLMKFLVQTAKKNPNAKETFDNFGNFYLKIKKEYEENGITKNCLSAIAKFAKMRLELTPEKLIDEVN